MASVTATVTADVTASVMANVTDNMGLSNDLRMDDKSHGSYERYDWIRVIRMDNGETFVAITSIGRNGSKVRNSIPTSI
jgi:hypothetical protein